MNNKNMNSNKSVDVCMISYNHEKYIAQAIEGVLMQKTDFLVRLVISDDGSSDDTLSIINEYIKKYPEKIVSISNTYNVGMMSNFIKTLKYCDAKYIALCEGDDYWIDDNKLQKQVNFLENNKEYAICFHNMKICYEDSPEKNKLSNPDNQKISSTIFDLAEGNYIYTASCVYKNNIKEYPTRFTDSPAGDYFLHMLNALYGDIYYMPDVMAVYRIHAGGVWAIQAYIPTVMKWYNVQAIIAREFTNEVKDTIIKSQYKTFISIIKSKEVNNEMIVQFIRDNAINILDMDTYLSDIHESNRIKSMSLEYRLGSVFIFPLRKLKTFINRLFKV